MDSLFLFPEEYLYDGEFVGLDEEHVWKHPPPTKKGVILYSLITPIICSFGICGNALSLIVLRRRELVGSVYTYLAVMATMDLLMSIVLFIRSVSKGILHDQLWGTYDALFYLPLSGIINSMSVMATVGVTVDRVIFLWNPVQCTKPRFCNPKIARKLMVAGFALSILLNLPYCFIFRRDEKKLKTTPFFDSRIYTIHNWFMLIFLAILPTIILMLGNGFLIMSLRNARKVSMKCNGKKRKDHTHLTIILVCIIILFLCCEIPSSLLSKANAVNILFAGNHKRANTRTIEILRQVCTLLSAINMTASFLFYYLFSPAFRRVLLNAMNLRMKRKKKFQINVFVVGDEDNQTAIKAQIVQMTKKGIDAALSASLFTDFAIPLHKNNMQDEPVPEENEYVEVRIQKIRQRV